jgi:hypothetical protein
MTEPAISVADARGISLELIRAARLFEPPDGHVDGDQIINRIRPDLPAWIAAAVAGALARRIAGRLDNDPDDRTDDPYLAMAILDICDAAIADGSQQRNLTLPTSRAMSELVLLARTDDNERRYELAKELAEGWAGSPHEGATIMGATFAGIQLIRYLADLSGQSGKLLDTIALELMETALTGPTKV